MPARTCTSFGRWIHLHLPPGFNDAVKNAYFDYDSYDLRPDAKAAPCSRMLSTSSLMRIMKVIVGGYSDERGTAEYNLALGEKRASAARDALISDGVSPSPA